MEILKFEFMRRAFIVGILLSIIIPLIGTVMVNKKNSMMGDALSHVSLSGVAIGFPDLPGAFRAADVEI